MNLAMKKIYFLIIPFLWRSQSCGVYSFTGASIPPEMKTITVPFFENEAALVVNYLSQDFTEELKKRIRETTKLSIVTAQGNASMSGAITDYRYAPISIPATGNNQAPIAGASVLSISVRVKFDYETNKKISFDQTFTKTQNYTGDLSTQEKALTKIIIGQLIDEIFNAAFNNW